MFITRFTQQQMTELAVLREKVTQLTAQLARSQASQEWLETRVTSLEMERAALTDKLFEVRYPVPVIERTNERAAGAVPGVYGRPVEEYAIPEHLRGAVVAQPPMAPPAPPARPPRPASSEEEVANSISALQASNTTFDDVGDDAARELGIQHDDSGNVVYTR